MVFQDIRTNTPAWDTLGRDVAPHQVDEAICEGDLDWTVSKMPLRYYDAEAPMLAPARAEIDGHYATVRSDNGDALGIVGRNYTVMDNREVFEYARNLVDSSDVEIEKVVSMNGGRVLTILAKRPDHILIGGEEVVPYILFANSHDASLAFQAMAMPTRTFCQNVLRGGPAHERERRIKMRHTASIGERLEESRRALDISFRYTEKIVAYGDRMASLTFSEREFRQFLGRLVSTPPDASPAMETRRNLKRRAIKLVHEGENLNNIRGTAWGALQAVAEYEQHVMRYISEERRMTALLLDQQPLTKKAAAILSRN